MRILFILLLSFALGFSCLKKKSIGPVPELEFLEFTQKTTASKDSATFKLGYVDSDGDLFRDKTSDGPNLIFKTLAYNSDSAKFKTNLTISKVIIQPAGGYYKDQSIQGYIYLQETEFRRSKNDRILKFEVYMTDMAGNKSNIVTSPTYTLTY